MKDTNRAVTDSGAAPSVSKTNKAIRNAFEEIRIQRDASLSVARELQSKEHHIIASTFDKALAAIRVRFPQIVKA